MTLDVVGVDGCRAGWIAARCSARATGFAFSIHRNFDDLLKQHNSACRIAVDIPIGLSECFTARRCDVEARKLLGRRGSSVFPAPDRRLLAFSTYAAANAFSKKQCGKGISQQSFHICPKIAQVDASITADAQGRIFEVHPEVCFLKAAGKPLLYSKRSPEGYEERRKILRRQFARLVIPQRSEIRTLVPGAGAADVQPDDMLDAMIAAWAALRHARGECERMPDTPEIDARGLRMEIIS